MSILCSIDSQSTNVNTKYTVKIRLNTLKLQLKFETTHLRYDSINKNIQKNSFVYGIQPTITTSKLAINCNYM